MFAKSIWLPFVAVALLSTETAWAEEEATGDTEAKVPQQVARPDEHGADLQASDTAKSGVAEQPGADASGAEEQEEEESELAFSVGGYFWARPTYVRNLYLGQRNPSDIIPQRRICRFRHRGLGIRQPDNGR